MTTARQISLPSLVQPAFRSLVDRHSPITITKLERQALEFASESDLRAALWPVRTKILTLDDPEIASLPRPVVNPFALQNSGFEEPGRTDEYDNPDLAPAGDALLRFHRRMLRTGRLTVPSPFGGELTSCSSIVLDYEPSRRALGSCAAYFFEGDSIVMIFGTEENWPIAWYDPISDVAIRHPRAIGLNEFIQERICELKLSCISNFSIFEKYLQNSTSERSIMLHMGALDYISTHVFTDLAAADFLAQRGEVPSQILVTAREVFGNIEDLFPETNEAIILRPKCSSICDLNRRLWSSNAFTVRVTGRLATNSLSKRILNLAERTSSLEYRLSIDEALRGKWPVIFLALRTHNRRWRIANEDIAIIFNRLQLRYPDIALILDGHGLTDEPGLDIILRAELEFHEAIGSFLHPDIPVISTAGRSMADGVYATSLSDCHLSAQGTSTTKPILVANKPGVVIGPKSFNWDVRGVRADISRCMTPKDEARDLDATDMHTDFDLSAVVVYDLILLVLEELFLCTRGYRATPV